MPICGEVQDPRAHPRAVQRGERRGDCHCTAVIASTGSTSSSYASAAPEHGYARCPDCTAPVDVVSVDALLSARAFHRECRNYAEADLLLEQLRAVCGVVVDDEKRFVTGQNQNSGHETAQMIMKIIEDKS